MHTKIYKRNWFSLSHTGKLMYCLLLALSLGSCRKFLDKKANQGLVIPETVADCLSLLDNDLVFALSYPTNGQSADNYYLTYTNYSTLQINDRNVYIWDPQANMRDDGGWPSAYRRIMYTNTVLETLAKINPKDDQQLNYQQAKGGAFFFRAFNFYLLAQIWAQPYHAATAGSDLGIPLRLTSDINEPTVRASVQETYDRIISDLKAAAAILPPGKPTSIIGKSRPTKAAAYAALARTYLAMADYPNAGAYADSSLKEYNTLLDYNQLSKTASFPIARYNAEVLLEAQARTAFQMLGSIAKVDSSLYRSYAANDLRSILFYKENTGANAGTYFFRGSYDASNSGQAFCGFATDEMYLTRAECFARANNTNAAMADLNTLLQTRWVTGTYVPMSAADANDALNKILTERRKELPFRAIRWTDLRRLNQEPGRAVTLTRVLNGVTYTLPPNDLRYTMLITDNILQRENMRQTPRQ